MVKTRALVIFLILMLPVVVLRARQDTPVPRLEITGVNASQMPTVLVTANVYDPLGQPITGLTGADFALTGDLVGLAQITSVENISDDNLPFATVLAIDTSTSMIGTPIENARRAAHAFIDNIGANDPVAIMTFDTQVLVAQDYTTDKAALHAVVDGLQAGGETALYQGAYEAVVHAAGSPTPRRAVVLLGDGAEYGGRSQVGREAAVAEALVRGVPVYTIGLGFGADRTYLQELSSSTNARSYETPTPEQLTQIYTDLAALLRSQYVLTLDAPLPLDGTQYNLRLEVTTPDGTAEATAVLRAPIPVPVVRLQRFDEPLTEPTEILATVLADDTITGVTFQLGDQEPVTLTTTPYAFTVNPADLPPGDIILSATATDDDGDQGSDVINLTIGALPSQISLSPDPAALGAIDEPTTFTVETSGQTPTTGVSIMFDFRAAITELSEPYTFTIDPLDFSPGENAVTVLVTNAGGVSSSQSFDFTAAPLPPQITVVGLQDGQSIDAPVTFNVRTRAQESVAQINASLNEHVIERNGDGSFTLDPIQFPPGANTVTITATTSGGLTSSTDVNVIIAALPPQIIVNGLTPGETLSADRDLTFDFVTQSPVIHVAVFVDGVDLAHLVRAPFGITLNVLDFAPGEHTLRVVAENSDGQSSTLDIPFTIAAEPAITATQAAVASATQQAQATQVAVQATQVALAQQATGTQAANSNATVAALSTQSAGAAQATATAAQATENALNASSTQSVADTAATQNAQATQAVQATATQEAVNATSTQTKIEASATQAAQVALNATATEVKVEATATQAALSTQNALATQAVEQALSEQATATDAARATQLANNLATLEAQMTATAQAQATATSGAEATQAAQATATDAARATQLAVDLATLEAQITATAQFAQATSTEQAILAATGDARATQQAISDSTGTAVFVATGDTLATQAAVAQQGTQAAQATQIALDNSMTQSAEAAATEEAQALQSVQNATATQAAQATQDTRATRSAVIMAQAQQATRSSLATANAQARLVAQATQDARATRSADATLTQQAQATRNIDNATATQAAFQATLTAEARNTLSALEVTATQFVVNATATRHVLETQTSLNASATQTAREATATLEAQQTGVAQATVNAEVTQNAVATMDRAALLTVTAQQLANLATATASANALATEVRTTQVAQAEAALATANAQATIDTRLTAVGPTVTPVGGGEQDAQNLRETTIPQPTPTLTEIQAQEPPANSNIAPILIIVIVILVIVVVLVLVMRGRGTPPTRR